MKDLGYTGYLVASLTWLALIYIEWQVPGFSGAIFPNYIVLLIALGCGVGSVLTSQTQPTHLKRRHWPGLIVFGALAAAVILRDGDVFGAYRIVLAVIVLLTPGLIALSLSRTKQTQL